MSQFFGAPAHNALVVPDMSQAIAKMLASGIGPIHVMSRVRAPARYRGQRHDPLISAAFLSSGNQQYELVAPHDDTPSAYTEFLQRHPQGGLHHVAYWSEDFAGAMQRAASENKPFQIVQEFIDGEGVAFEIYMEPVGEPDPVLVQLMHAGPFDAFFKNVEQIAASWDGSYPVRNAFDILPPEVRPPSEA